MKSKRNSISLSTRQKVYDKCCGHCAYCGTVISLKGMHVDHLRSLKRGGTDDLDNLMPSCSLCNTYKGASCLETLRQKIKITLSHYRDDHYFPLALRYTAKEIKPKWNEKFYFETVEKEGGSSASQ